MKYIISGGGTGGHIYPGLAIAKEIKTKEPDADILFVGTKHGLEGKLVPREGYDIKFIEVSGFKRKLSLDTLKTVFKLFKSFGRIMKILNEYKPDAVIGTGGYVCGPVVFSAALKKIPTIIHEQNAFPGVTNKILARYVDGVAISFEESRKRFKAKSKITLTGNPVRNEIFEIDRNAARAKLNIPGNVPLVVVFGGSLGAERINECIREMINSHCNDIPYHLIISTGMKHYEEFMRNIKVKLPPTIKVEPYLYNMVEILASCDVVVCRGGAITISEISALGIPSIIIPSPYVAENHQEYNARALEQKGAAVVILENQLNPAILYGQIQKLISDKELRHKMHVNAKKFGKRNSASAIYSLLKEIMRSKSV
ncbi:MAG: undecaprenyldiphospho-muramoylpentapeptide beta-N-acetylglucosaminyltransferase [Clostridiaceae bacterium]|nr:undecaprenyldiphospho-muramoylpentapeptide beta-N-acetylglucosaminyltransferase [Clostridiaceae bacterium]